MNLIFVYLVSRSHYDIHYLYISGNHYGTPKPPKDPKDSAKDGPMQRNSTPTTTTTTTTFLPGQHPSSEGKRKRNRSTIEATNRSPISRPDGSPPPPPTGGRKGDDEGDTDSLGPLPSNWEMAFTDDGTPYFIE